MDATISFTVNRQQRTVTTDGMRPLLDVIREDLQLTGTRFGCGEGMCGACTVLVDGKRTFSCRMPVQAAADKSIVTIEGLEQDGRLHPVQEAFLEENAFQCAYCTSGMILGAVELLNEKPNPTDGEIVAWMNRQICRCCTYPRILKAVRRAAGNMGR